jgi:hypothetical protein
MRAATGTVGPEFLRAAIGKLTAVERRAFSKSATATGRTGW